MSDGSPPQKTVAGRFRPREPIGSGGFGSVWRAVDEQGGPDVAIKFPLNSGTNDRSEVRARFRNECELLDQFGEGIHPTSLIRCIDSRSRDPMYAVLEYIRGPTLSERVNGKPAGVDAIDRFGVPVVRALEFLHRNGFCYQDCRPENVLVRKGSDSPVLIDFNTAEPTNSADTLFHEDGFKAPEQTPPESEKAAPGPWSDVYAAGKLFVYLLTGQRVPHEDTPERGINVSEYGIDVPESIHQLIQQATHADQSQRPRTAGELLTQLYRQLDGDTAIAELIDTRRNTRCPVRPGYTVGRIGESDDLPDIAAADSKQYVSPNHFEIDRDEESWLLRDRSLNGTWIAAGEQWQQLLSETGYHQLQREAPERAPNEQPYVAGHLYDGTEIALVDPSYKIRMTFST